MEKPASPSSRAVRERIGRSPRPAPALPRSDEQGLGYVLTIRPDPAQAHALRALLGDVPVLDFAHTGETRVGVFHWQGFTRVEALGGGLYGRDFVLIEDPDGGMTVLDGTDRLAFRADAEQVLPIRLPRDEGALLHVDRGDEIDGRTSQVATLDLAGPPRLRYRVWCVRDEPIEREARHVLCALLGCPRTLAASGLPVEDIAALGVPVRSEVHLLGRGHDDVPLVVGEVSRLELRSPAPGELEIPPGYDDLRDSVALSQRLGPRGHVVPAVRLSTLRRGRSEAQRVRAGTRPLGWAVTPAGADPAWIPVPGGPTPGWPGGPGEPHPPAPGDQTNRFRIPQCLPATFASLVSVATEQQLLDDLRYLFNQVAQRLDTFKGADGNLVIDWLDQWAASLADGRDDGVFCLMRSSEPPLGLLDRLAQRQVRRALQDGAIGSQVPMPPALQLAVLEVLGGKASTERWDALAPAARDQLRELYLTERLGKIRLHYKSTTAPTTTFLDLLNVQLNDLEFSLRIGHTQPLRNLDADQGALKLRVELPFLHAQGEIGRWPTGQYFAALGASAAGCFLLPLLCLASGPLTTVGMFLLSDYAYVRVELDDAAIDATIKFLPDPSNVLRPVADPLDLDADISVAYVSYVPTGLHQIASFVYSMVGTHTDVVLDENESQLKEALEDLFKETLALRFPPSFGTVPLSGLSTKTDGAPRDFLYLEAGLDAGAGTASPPYVTQVDPDIQPHLLALRSRFAFDRRYAGFVLSQNFLNHFVNVRWKEGAFSFHLGGPERGQVAAVVAAALQAPLDMPIDVHLWPAVSPRTVLTPRLHAELLPPTSLGGPYRTGPYATTFFDDLRLCVGAAGRDGGSQLEVQFAGQVFTQVGIGGLDPGTQELDLGRFADGCIELYFDLARHGVRVVHPETQGLVTRGEIFAPLTPSALPVLAPALAIAFTAALRSRSDAVIPTAAGDPFFHRYALPGATLDLHLEPFRGNLYGWLGLTGAPSLDLDPPDKGLIEIFPGGRIELDQFNCPTARKILGG